MAFIFTALLSLGLSLGQETLVLPGHFSKPTLRAHPGSVVVRGTKVTIECEATTRSQEYRLSKEGGPHPWRTKRVMEPSNKAEFLIPSVNKNHAGQYHCYYETPTGWSEKSDTLELVVTGVYHSKVSLLALPSLVVTSGGNMTLQCVSQLGFDRFALTKEQEQKPLVIQDSQSRNSTGQFQALFPLGPMGPVTFSQKWIFKCYGYHITSPQVWSEPSEPLEILILGSAQPSSPPSNLSDSKKVSQPQDHTVENLIRMAVAGLVLVVLGILLFEAQHNQRRIQPASRS